MDELLLRLGSITDVRIEQSPTIWSAHHTRAGLRFEILVADSAFEWFVTVRDPNGMKLWSDWMDYAGYVPKHLEDPEQLASDMHRDIEWFISTLASVEDFRVVNERVLCILPGKAAEWRISGQWQRVSLVPPGESQTGS